MILRKGSRQYDSFWSLLKISQTRYFLKKKNFSCWTIDEKLDERRVSVTKRLEGKLIGVCDETFWKISKKANLITVREVSSHNSIPLMPFVPNGHITNSASKAPFTLNLQQRSLQIIHVSSFSIIFTNDTFHNVNLPSKLNCSSLTYSLIPIAIIKHNRSIILLSRESHIVTDEMIA